MNEAVTGQGGTQRALSTDRCSFSLLQQPAAAVAATDRKSVV
jgi:hypothetical protein